MVSGVIAPISCDFSDFPKCYKTQTPFFSQNFDGVWKYVCECIFCDLCIILCVFDEFLWWPQVVGATWSVTMIAILDAKWSIANKVFWSINKSEMNYWYDLRWRRKQKMPDLMFRMWDFMVSRPVWNLIRIMMVLREMHDLFANSWSIFCHLC